MDTVTQMPTTLSATLAAIARRETPPPWHELQPLIEAAAAHTAHVSGCTVEGCGAWTEAPDPFGRCVEHMIACDACGLALCLDCYAEWDTDAPPVRHGRHCYCDRCVAAADDARKARVEEGR
jgi:hypothetical protein